MKGFLGAAGTGKTFRLMQEVESWLSKNPISEHQYVLALTRMHGFRRRLIERLTSTNAKRRFECMTLDRFAWLVASRWRSIIPVEQDSSTGDVDYARISRSAATALQSEAVGSWLRAHYPLILIDELQDCHGEQLALIKELALSGEILVAADEFQDLTLEGDAPAVVWLRSLNCSEELTTNYRTEQAGLLAGANAIRTGNSLARGSGFKILQARNANVGASYLAHEVLWSKGAELVVLSPTSPESSPFVQKVLSRTARDPFIKRGCTPVGPYNISWHGSMKNRVGNLCTALGLPDDPDLVISFEDLPIIDTDDGALITEWLNRRRKLGRTSGKAGELRRAVQTSLQQTAAWQHSPKGLWGTTIHGAKNREFERVVILWPHEVKSGQYGARLLYNAVTRARKYATIIVQDTSGKRMEAPPFVANTPAADDPPSSRQLALF